MFLGTYSHSLDPKNRLVIPGKILVQLENAKIVISKGFDGCLELRSMEAFETYSQKLLTLSQNKLNTRTLLRQLLANAADVELDSAKRILIPSNLVDEANLSRDVIIIGLGDKCEIWDAEAYKAFKHDTDGALEKLAENIDNE